MSNDEHDEFEVEEIEKSKFVSNIQQYFVRWKGFDKKYNTWEPIQNLVNCEEKIRIYHENQAQSTSTPRKKVTATVVKPTGTTEKRLLRAGKDTTGEKPKSNTVTVLTRNPVKKRSPEKETKESNDVASTSAAGPTANKRSRIAADQSSERSSNVKARAKPKKFPNVHYVPTCDDAIVKICYEYDYRANVLTPMGITKLVEAFEKAAKSEPCKVVLFHTPGPIFSAGLDYSALYNSLRTSKMKPESITKKYAKAVRALTDCLIQFPKILVAQVQGPAMGLGFMMLTFFDFVYASNQATFSAPYAKLGQSPEGCSSYMLPMVAGRLKANEILIQGLVLRASEAMSANLVSQVYPHNNNFTSQVHTALNDITPLNSEVLKITKQKMRMFEVETMKRLSEEEHLDLCRIWSSSDFINNECTVDLKVYLSPEDTRQQYVAAAVVLDRRSGLNL